MRREVPGVWSKSHWSQVPGRRKVPGMNQGSPPVSRERRSVPRHLRDNEHDMSGAAPGSGTRAEDVLGAGRRTRLWIYAAVATVIVGLVLWLGLGTN